LVFIEVKTRRSVVYGAPAEAVTKNKQELISRGALAWLKLLGSPDIYFRFDIVEVLFVDGQPTSCILENAFTLPERYRY
jgi:putative endonuclease